MNPKIFLHFKKPCLCLLTFPTFSIKCGRHFLSKFYLWNPFEFPSSFKPTRSILWNALGSVQEDEGPLRCNPSFQKQDHVTKKYINPSLTQHLVWLNPSLTCHGTCRIGSHIVYALYNYKTRSRYVVIKHVRDLQIIKKKLNTQSRTRGPFSQSRTRIRRAIGAFWSETIAWDCCRS